MYWPILNAFKTHYNCFLAKFKRTEGYPLEIYFGNPGSGKTTFAMRLIKESRMTYKFANFENDLCPTVDLLYLGHWTFPPDSLIVIDEAGIEYNNRKFKTFDQATIKWFKYHRHQRCRVVILSQSYDDMDITLRRLADKYFHMRKLGPFTLIRRIRKFVTINEYDRQIIDGYEFYKLIWRFIPIFKIKDAARICLRSKYYKYFDSFSPLPVPIWYGGESS